MTGNVILFNLNTKVEDRVKARTAFYLIEPWSGLLDRELVLCGNLKFDLDRKVLIGTVEQLEMLVDLLKLVRQILRLRGTQDSLPASFQVRVAEIDRLIGCRD